MCDIIYKNISERSNKMKIKKILSLSLSLVLALSMAAFALGVENAEDTVLDFTKVQKGICDANQGVDTGVLDIVKDSAKGEVVRFTINPSAKVQRNIVVDGYGAKSYNIDAKKYKYMVLEMRFVSDTVENVTPGIQPLSIVDGDLEKRERIKAQNALVSDGKWHNVVFDIGAGIGAFASGDTAVINHVQYFIGGFEDVAAKFGAGDQIYVGKMILTNEQYDTSTGTEGGTDAPAVKLPEKDVPTENTNTSSSDSEKFKDEDRVIPFTEMPGGVVDHKDTFTQTKVNDAEMGEVVEIAINNSPEKDDTVNLEGWGVQKNNIDATKHKYMIIDMKLESSRIEKCTPVINILSAVDVSMKSSASAVATEPLVADGKWHKVVFNIYNALESVVNSNASVVLKQYHFKVSGSYAASSFGEGDKFSIGNLTLTNNSPNKDRDFKATFSAGFTGAEGKAPADIVGKPGTKITLPEVPFTAKSYEAVGWIIGSNSSKVYFAGEEMTLGEEDLEFTAAWKQIVEVMEYVDIDFSGYSDGICDHVDTATLEKTTLDGKTVLEVVPNPNPTPNAAGKLTKHNNLDGWSYGGANVSLEHYKTVVVEYLYISENPIKDVKPRLNIMKRNLDSGINAIAPEPILEGRWATMSFDVSSAEEHFIKGVDPKIQQMHFIPLGYEGDVTKMSADDRLYIGKMYFIPEVSTGSAYHESYINGYTDGSFGISGNMTRAEACTIVARLAAGGDEKVPENLTTSFGDVPSSEWYHKYIAYVESLGYLKSYSGSFEPNRKITRAEFVELVYNMGLLTDAGKNGDFTDVPTDHARAEVIAMAGKAGLINGYANGDGTFSFKPDNTITRAEVVKVINNACGRTPKADGIKEAFKTKFTDVKPDHWAFADIIDASVGHISCLDEEGKEFWKVIVGEKDAAAEEDIDYAAGLAKLKEADELLEKRKNEILSTPNMDLSDIKGKRIYVSESSGNDANDGATEATPVKTIKQAQQLAGDSDVILLKRGDMWRERFRTKEGLTYTAYGEGKKPIINANEYGDAADPSLWTLVEGTTNVYKYAKTIPDVGNIVVNWESTIEKLVDPIKIAGGKMTVSGSPIDVKTCLEDNFFVNVYTTMKGTSIDNTSSELYVRCDKGNPGEVYDSIELCYGGNGISGTSKIHMDNIAIFFAGRHGIGMGTVSDVKFTNMEVGWQGGVVGGTNSNGTLSRLGNGIEVYGGCDNYVIDNCYVYQCYDAGITNQKQLGGTDACTEMDVYFTNNVIEKCIYNIEYFMGIADDKSVTRIMKNINYTDNILSRSGYGWGAYPSRAASIKGWRGHNNHADGFTVENNLFIMDKVNAADLGAGSMAWIPAFKNNTYIQKYGNTLTNVGENGGKQYTMDGKAAENLEAGYGEKGAQLYYVPADTIVE